MAKDKVTHNEIEYFGIATYGDVNTASDSIIFSEPLNRCLSKQIANNYSSNFNYTDDDENPGKLLKFNSINFFNTIPIVIYNNPTSYNVSLETCVIQFSENINNTSLSASFPDSTIKIPKDDEQIFTIKNNRGLMPDPFFATKSGTISLRIYIYGKTCGNTWIGVSGKRVTCTFNYYIDDTIYTAVTPPYYATSDNSGYFIYNYTFNLSWIKSNVGIGSTSIQDNTLNTVWPTTATKIKIQINAGT